MARRGACAAPGWAADASAQNLASFEARTTVHVLPNGWTFIICERPGAPVFSFATQADVGAAQDPKGQTGMAHMFEHMAFKGTRVIGTTDWAKEGPALEKMDAAYMAWQKAKDARGADPEGGREAARRPSRRRRPTPSSTSSRTSSTSWSRARAASA